MAQTIPAFIPNTYTSCAVTMLTLCVWWNSILSTLAICSLVHHQISSSPLVSKNRLFSLSAMSTLILKVFKPGQCFTIVYKSFGKYWPCGTCLNAATCGFRTVGHHLLLLTVSQYLLKQSSVNNGEGRNNSPKHSPACKCSSSFLHCLLTAFCIE